MRVMTTGTVFLFDRAMMVCIFFKPFGNIRYRLTRLSFIFPVVAAQTKVHRFHYEVLCDLRNMSIMTVETRVMNLGQRSCINHG